jgi:type II secretory pathway component PulM
VLLAENQVFRKERRRKSPAALRNPEMERALRLQWSELLERERDMLIAGALSPAHVPSEQ